MIKKLFLFVLIFFLLTPKLIAADLTYEIIMSGVSTKNSSIDSEIYGTIFAKILAKENVQADLHYQFGNNRNKINVGNVKFTGGIFDITLGRQLMAWGTGYNFNPTDIFNSKPLGAAFDPVYTKNGRDAISVTSYYGGFITEAIFAIGYKDSNKIDSITEEGDEDLGLRLKKNLFDYDVALSFANIGERSFNSDTEPKDTVYGFSAKGSIPKIDWGIWLEAARYTDQEKNEWVAGLEYIYDAWTFNIEYYNNGFGETEKSKYDTDMLYRGKTLGRNYCIPSINYMVNERLNTTLFSFNNLNDSSFIIGGVIDYYYNNIIEIAFLPFVISGNQTSEYGIQKSGFGEYGIQGLIKVVF